MDRHYLRRKAVHRRPFIQADRRVVFGGVIQVGKNAPSNLSMNKLLTASACCHFPLCRCFGSWLNLITDEWWSRLTRIGMKELRFSAVVLYMKNYLVFWLTLIKSLNRFRFIIFPGDKQTAGMKADLHVMWELLQ